MGRLGDPPFKMELGEGGDGIPFRVPFSLLWGRLNNGIVGPPTPSLKVGGMLGVGS